MDNVSNQCCVFSFYYLPLMKNPVSSGQRYRDFPFILCIAKICGDFRKNAIIFCRFSAMLCLRKEIVSLGKRYLPENTKTGVIWL